jgi:hypothetical protein
VTRGRRAAVLGVLALGGYGSAAEAYDPATTHAGLTERAVLASGLHRVLVRRLSRPLGLFEPVALRTGDLPPEVALPLEGRLATLDPSAGYRPGPDGVASALSWVIAGSVIAQTPAERGQHLFYDPSRGSGLTDRGGVLPFGQGLRQLLDAGGGRGARVRDRHGVQHDRAALDRVAGLPGQRRRADGLLR